MALKTLKLIVFIIKKKFINFALLIIYLLPIFMYDSIGIKENDWCPKI